MTDPFSKLSKLPPALPPELRFCPPPPPPENLWRVRLQRTRVVVEDGLVSVTADSEVAARSAALALAPGEEPCWDVVERGEPSQAVITEIRKS